MSLRSNGDWQQFAERSSLAENTLTISIPHDSWPQPSPNQRGNRGTWTNVDSRVLIAVTMLRRSVQTFPLWNWTYHSFPEWKSHSLPRSLVRRSQAVWPFSGPSRRLEGCQWRTGCRVEEAS